MGGDSNGVAWKDFCWEEWKAKYGTSPPWGKIEFIVLAETRHRIDTEDLARAAWTKFLASPNPFFQGHEPKKFLASLSQWVAAAVPRLRRDKMQEDPAYAGRAEALIRIHAEVAKDDSIPSSEKQNVCSRRFKEMFPS